MLNNSSSSTKPVRHAEKARRSDKATGKEQVAPALAVAAGAAARSAQLSKTGLRTADSGYKGRKGRQAAKVAEDEPRLQLTRPDVQKMLDPERVDMAAAAFEALQKEAEQADHESKWMLKYFQSAFIPLLRSYKDAEGQAGQLYDAVGAWDAMQETLKGSLARAVCKTREQLGVIREAWEGEVQAIFDSIPDRGEKSLLPADAFAMVKAYSDGFGSMEGCLKIMQERYASFVRSAKALRQSIAATIYIFIRLVRCRGLSCRASPGLPMTFVRGGLDHV